MDIPRPTLGRRCYKAHGLGNDYLVFEEGDAWTATPAAIRLVCDRFRGVGSDGIVVLAADAERESARLRMFNPDGGEFERSGNGLRVLASYLARLGRVGRTPFAVEVGGDVVAMTVHSEDRGVYDVSVDMGRARVGPDAVALDPSALDARGRLSGPHGEALDVVPVSVGNPHLVTWLAALDEASLSSIGPFLASHPALANGANVQLAVVRGEGICDALIWERGVGRTSASGTSACAVAVASVHRGENAPGPVEVRMPGGSLKVTVSRDLEVELRGPVQEVFDGAISDGLLALLNAS